MLGITGDACSNSRWQTRKEASVQEFLGYGGLMPMQYRRFGRTELAMPVFSCGGMRYQHKWTDVPPEEIPAANQANLEATILRSLEAGINHIETARGYGTSEMQLGRILPTLPREKMIIQTKVAPTADPREFLANFTKSMAYLRLGHVELLSLHGINNEEVLGWALRKGGCLEAARQLQREGRCRHIGFSTHAYLPTILNAVNSGEFDYVNLHWYFIYPFNWPAVQRARELDMGIFIISPNDKGGMLYQPSPKLAEACHPLSPMIFNDLFCLSHPEIHTLSLGAGKPSDFDEHLKALEYYDRASETMVPIRDRLNALLAEELGRDWWDNWWRDLPAWDEIPGQINVFEILRLWNLAKALDMRDYGRMRYNLLGNAGHWFPGHSAEKLSAHNLASALESSRFAPLIPERLREAHDWLHGEAKKRLSESD
jgi:predicted aldo/keto reductase-like oxidoreductase